MTLIPYRTITFNTRLSKADAINCFRKAVFTKPPHPLYFRGPTDYLAEIYDDHFTVRRLQEYMPIPNTKGYAKLIPMIQGQFIDSPTGSILLIKMYPHFLGILIVGGLILSSLYSIFYALKMWLSTGYFFYDVIGFLFITNLSYILIVDNLNSEAERIQTFLDALYHNEK